MIDMYIKSIDEFESVVVPQTQGASIAVLTPQSDDDFMVRRVSLEEGGSMPYHTNEIQHQQFVLSGEAKVILDGIEHHAKAGDFIYIPAGIKHSYEACYGVVYEFLCMIPDRLDSIEMID